MSVFEADMRCDWAAAEDFARSGDSCSTLRMGGVRLLSSSSGASSSVPLTSGQQQYTWSSICKTLWPMCNVTGLLHWHGVRTRTQNIPNTCPVEDQYSKGQPSLDHYQQCFTACHARHLLRAS